MGEKIDKLKQKIAENMKNNMKRRKVFEKNIQNSTENSKIIKSSSIKKHKSTQKSSN